MSIFIKITDPSAPEPFRVRVVESPAKSVESTQRACENLNNRARIVAESRYGAGAAYPVLKTMTTEEHAQYMESQNGTKTTE